MIRVGIGYDIHRLISGRKLILGGVDIPFEKGLLGHSDADVLVHALCDALLGAAGLGDIGSHFPDTDPALEGISSLHLLADSHAMVSRKGFRIENMDATVFAEAPKLAAYRDTMRQRVAGALNLEPDRINIKATTMEGLGAIGKGDGIGAMCVVLLARTE